MNRRLWLVGTGAVFLAGCGRRRSLPRLPHRFADNWILRPGGPPYRYEHGGSALNVDVRERANSAVAFEDLQKFRPINGVTAFQYDRFFIVCRSTGIEQNSFLYLVATLRNEWLRVNE